jgi:hypothetical protein
MLSISEFPFNASGDLSTLQGVHRGCALDDHLQLGLQGPMVSRRPCLEPLNGSFVEISDEYSGHGLASPPSR